MTPSLVQLLSDALDLEFAGRPRIAALATVDDQATPRVRSVIVRKLTDTGDLWIASDGRSEKNHHLRRNPRAELVLYLAGRREQFRLLGQCTRHSDGTLREEAWRMIPDQTRALFLGPPPGTPRVDCDDHFLRGCPETSPIPASFELLVLAPDEVDHVRLSSWPHGRTRYRAVDGWEGRELNP